MNNDPSMKHTFRTVIRSAGVGLLAAATWSAAAFHAVTASSIVVASYFSAWVSRIQHRFLQFFAAYGGAVLLDEDDSVEATQDEVEAAQRGAEATPVQTQAQAVDAEWSEAAQHEELPPPNLFGGRPPKGQA